MTTHSERAVRTRMRERGIRPTVGNIEKVMADMKAAQRSGRVPSNMGAPDSRVVAAKRAAAIRADIARRGGGRPV